MTNSEIQAASDAGNSNWEVLQMVVDSGVEFPDAVWKVSKALGLRDDERQQMETDYDECC